MLGIECPPLPPWGLPPPSHPQYFPDLNLAEFLLVVPRSGLGRLCSLTVVVDPAPGAQKNNSEVLIVCCLSNRGGFSSIPAPQMETNRRTQTEDTSWGHKFVAQVGGTSGQPGGPLAPGAPLGGPGMS